MDRGLSKTVKGEIARVEELLMVFEGVIERAE